MFCCFDIILDKRKVLMNNILKHHTTSVATYNFDVDMKNYISELFAPIVFTVLISFVCISFLEVTSNTGCFIATFLKCFKVNSK